MPPRQDDDNQAAAPGPDPEPAAYHLHELVPLKGKATVGKSMQVAQALGTQPWELVAALHGREGPFTREQIDQAVQEWRQREIPPAPRGGGGPRVHTSETGLSGRRR